ncbi:MULTISPECIES: DUF6758 family protein [Nocardioides]|uniref:DUF6758 family protein n=1 Tax=Nocardioides TaxID=1839 RepID=UPI000330A0DE|nr:MULTISPECIES: DUF6758 family protein [Nocardioides]EON24734.1 hypothetical protein CF8_1222 [Nocardioides sp. CF8]
MLRPGCPRCGLPLTETDASWACPEHGPTPPLWRPQESTYDAFVRHLGAAAGFPTYLPWPMGPGWRVTDFGVVVQEGSVPRATMSCVSGTSVLDGPVDVLVVSEEPGTGLGARAARLASPDPRDIGEGPPVVKVRLGHGPVSLWAVSTSDADEEFDRYVMVGEAAGRWLWLVLRPASAMLLMRDEWILRDVAEVGAPLIEMPFGGPPPAW